MSSETENELGWNHVTHREIAEIVMQVVLCLQKPEQRRLATFGNQFGFGEALLEIH